MFRTVVCFFDALIEGCRTNCFSALRASSQVDAPFSDIAVFNPSFAFLSGLSSASRGFRNADYFTPMTFLRIGRLDLSVQLASGCSTH